jgi:hypothetical protein
VCVCGGGGRDREKGTNYKSIFSGFDFRFIYINFNTKEFWHIQVNVLLQLQLLLLLLLVLNTRGSSMILFQ